MRYWIDDNIDYQVFLDDEPADYCGLVDEEMGGIVAFGTYDNLSRVLKDLNPDPVPNVALTLGRAEKWLNDSGPHTRADAIEWFIKLEKVGSLLTLLRDQGIVVEEQTRRLEQVATRIGLEVMGV